MNCRPVRPIGSRDNCNGKPLQSHRLYCTRPDFIGRIADTIHGWPNYAQSPASGKSSVAELMERAIPGHQPVTNEAADRPPSPAAPQRTPATPHRKPVRWRPKVQKASLSDLCFRHCRPSRRRDTSEKSPSFAENNGDGCFWSSYILRRLCSTGCPIAITRSATLRPLTGMALRFSVLP